MPTASRGPVPGRYDPVPHERPYENTPPGCLTWPARIIAIIIVVPIRMLWEAAAAVGRAVSAVVLEPLGRLLGHVLGHVLGRPARWLFTVLVVLPLRWAGRAILMPLGRWLYAYVLVPLGRGLFWALAGLLMITLTPLVYVLEAIGKGLRALYRWARPALAAVGRVIVDALAFACGVAAAVVGFLGRVLFHTLIRPVRWAWRTAVRPVLVSSGQAIAWTWYIAVASPVGWARRNLL